MPGDIVTGTEIQATTFDQWYKTADINLRYQQAQNDLAIAQANLQAQLQAAGISAQAQITAANISAAAQTAIAQAQMEVQKAQLAFDMVNADREYGLNVQKFGLERAGMIWQQEVQKAQFGLDVAQFGLQKAQFNASQRKAEIDAKLKALEMLASKTGPQDWVNYNNLLGGLSSPEALARGEVNPFSMIEGMYQPYEGEAPAMPVANPIPEYSGPAPQQGTIQGYLSQLGGVGNLGGGGGGAAMPQFNLTPPQIGGGFGGGGSLVQPTPPPGTGTPPPPASTAAPFSGVEANNPALANLLSGQGALVTTGTAGPSLVSDYIGYNVFTQEPGTGTSRQLAAGESIPGGTPIWLQKMGKGGITNADTLLVGEEGPEIIQSLGIDPKTGNAILRVHDNEDTAKLMGKGKKGKKKAALGGRFGMADMSAGDYNTALGGQAVPLGGTVKMAPTEPLTIAGASMAGGNLLDIPGAEPMMTAINPQPRAPTPEAKAAAGRELAANAAAARTAAGTPQTAPPSLMPTQVGGPSTADRRAARRPRRPRAAPKNWANPNALSPEAAAISNSVEPPLYGPGGSLDYPGALVPGYNPNAPIGPNPATAPPWMGPPPPGHHYDQATGTFVPDTPAAPPPPPQVYPNPAGVPAGSFSGVAAASLEGMQPGEMVLVTTGAAGPSNVDDYVGYTVFGQVNGTMQALPAGYQIPAGTAIWLQKMVGAATGGTFSMSNQSGQNAYIDMLRGMGAETTATPEQYQNAAGSYGNSNPYTFQFNQYSPEVLGNMPFIQKLRGTMATPEFNAFGASISNPNLGVTNMPWALNYKTLLNLNPSERDMAKSLYEQGLGIDFRDVMEQSRRAAPTGASFGAARYTGR